MKAKIGTDSGVGNSKAALMLEDGKVLTTVFPTTATLEESSDGKFVTYFESNRWVVGEVDDSLTVNDITLSKLTDTHKLATLTAITDLINKAKLTDVDEVELAVNMPLSLYKDVNEREKTIKFYNQDDVKIKVNGKEYEFKLRVTPYFEGLGVALRNSSKLGEDEVVVIDFGTLNVNVATFGKNKKPIGSKSVCLGREYGCKALVVKVQSALEPIVGQTLSVDTTIEVIQGKKKNMPKGTEETVKRVVNSHLQDIYGRLVLSKIDLQFSEIIVSGGGTLLMKDYIDDVFGKETIKEEDPLFANAIGSLYLLK